MLYMVSVLVGVLIAIMLVPNGLLTDVYGVFTAATIIHLVGLVVVSLCLLVRRQRLLGSLKGVPFWPLLCGLVGVATTALNNYVFGIISMSVILAFTLLGQVSTSLVLDTFGLMDSPKQRFRPGKLAGIAIVCLGIVFILVL